MLQEIRQTVTPAWLRSFLALAMVLLTVSFMNVAVFPLFDSVNAYAREAATLANTAGFILIGAAALFSPHRLNAAILNIFAFIALLAAAILIPAALTLESTSLLFAAAILVGLARSWVMTSAGLACSTLSSPQLGSCIVAAFLVFYPCDIIALSCPAIVSVTLFLGFPMLSLALSAHDADPALEAASSAESPLDLAVTQPNTFLPLGSQIFVCLFIFRVAYGFALRFGEEAGAPLISTWAILAIAAVAVYMLLARKSLPLDAMVNWSILLVILGFYAVAVGRTILPHLGVTLLSAGSTLFDMASWMILLAIMRRNIYGATAVFAWGHALMGIGTVLGAQIAVGYNTTLLTEQTPLFIASGLFIALFASYGLLALRGVSFVDAVSEINPASPGTQAAAAIAESGEEPCADAAIGVDECSVESTPQAPEQDSTIAPPLSIEQRCERIAERFKLTRREAEILGMLARGRNRAYIEEALVVSRNTVNSHVKHIYTKLDVHSHQELLDIVENEE